LKNLFLKSPYFIKVILTNIVAYRQQKQRYNKNFYKALAYYNAVDYTETFSFDKEKFLKQIKGNDYFDTSADISDYPIINKENIKKDYDKIINKNKVFSYLYTSGTTGSGLKFPVSSDFLNHQWAVFWKFRNIHNLTTDTWVAYFIGRTLFDINQTKPPYWISSYPTKQFLLSVYHLNEQTIESYLDAIIKKDLHWIHAYPSVLHEISNLIKANHLEEKARKMNIKVITTSSEKLFAHQKENIESVFGCSVRQLYGLTEGVVNIFECEKGGFHIDESYSYVELIPKEGENKQEYKIIGTSYHNSAFPLVRYDTGDTCIVDQENSLCSCGRKSRVVKEILGRDEDYLILGNGVKLGRLDHIFKALVNIKEAQIYQKEIGSAEFRVVKGERYSDKDEEQLRSEIEEKLGKEFNYEIVYLPKIEKAKRGKLKFVVNEVKL
jgi:phenylacetate-CoA ligase